MSSFTPGIFGFGLDLITSGSSAFGPGAVGLSSLEIICCWYKCLFTLETVVRILIVPEPLTPCRVSICYDRLSGAQILTILALPEWNIIDIDPFSMI